MLAFSPTMVPSFFTPNSALMTKSRPCTSDTMSSERPATHFNGLSSVSAAFAAAASSGASLIVTTSYRPMLR